MAGPPRERRDPAIHGAFSIVGRRQKKDVDARTKSAHDVKRGCLGP